MGASRANNLAKIIVRLNVLAPGGLHVVPRRAKRAPEIDRNILRLRQFGPATRSRVHKSNNKKHTDPPNDKYRF